MGIIGGCKLKKYVHRPQRSYFVAIRSELKERRNCRIDTGYYEKWCKLLIMKKKQWNLFFSKESIRSIAKKNKTETNGEN